MRISTSQIHDSGVADMQRINREIAATQAQISSTRKIARPSDDPVGAAKIVALDREIEQRKTYIRNTEAAENLLTQEEGVLSRTVDILQRVQELVIQAGNSVQSSEDRRYIAVEVESRFAELTELINTRSPDGTYMFSGNRGYTRPFEIDGESIRYAGDEGQRVLQVDRNLFIPTSDSGSRVFTDVPAVRSGFKVVAAETNRGNALAHPLAVADEEALDEIVPDTLIIEFRPLAEAGGVTNYTVRRQSDGRVVDGLENVAFNPGETVRVAGMELTISGQPLEGDGFFVETADTTSLMDTVTTLVKGLRNIDPGTEPDKYQRMIDDAIGNLNSSTDQILQVRSDIGARLNTLSATRTFHEEQNLATEEVLSEVRDVDYAEAVSRLSFQTFVLEAAQQSFIRVSRLSLFNAL